MMLSPFEYYDDKLGVQGRFIFYGDNAHDCSLHKISESGLCKKIKRGNIVKLRPQGPNTPMLIWWVTLPPEWQAQLIKAFGNPPELVRQSWCERLYERDTAAYNFYLTFSDEAGSLDDDKIEEYTVNASVLNLVSVLYDKRCEYRKSLRHGICGNGPVPSVRDSITKDINNFRQKVSHTLPNNTVRLFEKLKKYKKDDRGYITLIHGNRGNNNARVVTVDVEKFLNDLFAGQNTKPTAAEIYDIYEGFLEGQVDVINNETGEIYNHQNFAPLSMGSVTAYLAKWRNRIGTYAIRSGDRQKYMSRFKPYHSLEQPKMAGSIISIDDRQPPFEYEKGKRMWFYNGIDLGSEAFIGWVYGQSKEGIILDFYRQLVRNYAEWGFNIPAEIEAESSLNSSFTDTFLQEGAMFQYVRIEANNARGKRIEAYYKPLRYKFEKKREGWLARPFVLSEANQAGPHKVPIIPYNNLIQQCLTDIQTWNNMEHSKIKGKSRWEVFCETQNPAVRSTNYRAIIPYLGYKTETSCNAGIIDLQNAEFLLGHDGLVSTGNNLIALMERVEGRKIDVYWLDGNDRKVLKAYVYIDNKCICEAIAKPGYNRARIEQTPHDLANRELMSKYVATIEGFGRRQRSSIDRVTVIDNRDVCINHKFVIPEIARYTTNGNTNPEVLGEPVPDLNEIESAFNNSLKDRF